MSTRTVTPLRQRVIKRIGFEHLWPSVPICSTSLYIIIDAIDLHIITAIASRQAGFGQRAGDGRNQFWP